MEKGHFGIDAIYCINLKSRQDRWLLVQKEFKRQGFKNIIRIDAIETPENGHLGCFLSHLSIYEISLKNKYKNILIFEDDVQFFYEKNYLFDVLKELKNNIFDIVYLGGGFGPVTRLRYFSPSWYRAEGIWLMHSYIISARMMKFMLKRVKQEGGPHQVIYRYKNFDKWIACSLSQALICFFPKLVFCTQRSNFSDISGEYKIRPVPTKIAYIFFELLGTNCFFKFLHNLILRLYHPYN